MTPQSPVAFVLSGGASLGAIQVGMLRALYERAIKPDLIVATSVGAINGAFIAGRPQTVETADELAAIWKQVRRSQVFPLNPLSGLLGFLGSRSHLVPDSGLRRLLAKHVERERLDQLPIPLHVVAVDVVSGDELLLSSGLVVDAVMASAAIPAVLPPVAWCDRELMDGGVANNTRYRTPSPSAPARSTCFRPVTRARWRTRRAARLAWRCTRSACSPTAA